MNTPRDPTLLSTWIRRIDKVGRRPPSAALRAELYEALDSKWEGVAVHAARALCRWGDRASVARVRHALATLAERPGRDGPVSAIAEALIPCLSEDDLDWIIEVLFIRAHRDNRWSLRVLLSSVPGEVAIDLVKQVGADPRVERAQLAWTLRVLGDSQRRVRALLDQLVGAQG